MRTIKREKRKRKEKREKERGEAGTRRVEEAVFGCVPKNEIQRHNECKGHRVLRLQRNVRIHTIEKREEKVREKRERESENERRRQEWGGWTLL